MSYKPTLQWFPLATVVKTKPRSYLEVEKWDITRMSFTWLFCEFVTCIAYSVDLLDYGETLAARKIHLYREWPAGKRWN